MRAIVGSSSLPLSVSLISSVAAILAQTDPEELAVRASSSGDPASATELLVDQIGQARGRSIIRFSPGPGGRQAVYHRDYDLVESSSAVYAFFDTDNEMEGGTGHVVKAALDRGIPVEAYSITPEDEVRLIGSDDGTPRLASSNEVLRRMWEEAQ